MPRALSLPIRHVIIDRLRGGASQAAVAAELGLSPWTVRTIWRRYRDGGAAALVPRYARCGRHGVRAAPRLHRAACWLRRRHPSWGADLICAILAERYPHERHPHPRTVRRWFAAQGLQRPPPPPREPPPPRATIPHATWQLDAKEQIRLGDGSRASWLTATDEASGAVVVAVVSPPRELDAGRPAGGASGVAPGVHHLGAAPAAARGQ